MGGTPPYTFSVISGALPAGLFLNATSGAITGTPTTQGLSSFTAQAVDSSGNVDSNTVTLPCGINVYPPVTSTCVTINATQNVPITPVTMTGSGGVGGPYTFSATGLPSGLTMASNGAISGAPTVTGTFNYTVTITDSGGNTGTVNCSVTVNPPLSVTCAATSTGEVGVAFNSGPMTITGGTAPYTFSVVGTLPAGLTLNTSTGAVTGTPTSSGTFSIQVTDASGAVGTACAITINPPLSVTCAATSTGEVGVAFNSGPMTITGGTAPYTFTVVGTLPAGLTLNTSTGAVTGTPTSSGTFSIQVTDAGGAVGTACAITINPPLSVTCAAVSTGEVGIAFNSGPMTIRAALHRIRSR